MQTLASRLKALAKLVALLEHDEAHGKEVPPAVRATLLQLEAYLQEIETTLPARRQSGRPRQPEMALRLFCGMVDVLQTLPELGVKTDRAAIQWFLRSRKGKARINLKTLQNKLARARKLPR